MKEINVIYILILNNYLHDLFTASFFIISLIFYLIFKLKKEEIKILKVKIIPLLDKTFWLSFFLILLTGFPRVYFFLNYEINLDISIRGALIIKHIILFLVVIFCFINYFKFKKLIKSNSF